MQETAETGAPVHPLPIERANPTRQRAFPTVWCYRLLFAPPSRAGIGSWPDPSPLPNKKEEESDNRRRGVIRWSAGGTHFPLSCLCLP